MEYRSYHTILMDLSLLWLTGLFGFKNKRHCTAGIRLIISPRVSGPGASSAPVAVIGLKLHHPTRSWFRMITYRLVTPRMPFFCMAETTFPRMDIFLSVLNLELSYSRARPVICSSFSSLSDDIHNFLCCYFCFYRRHI